MSAPSGAVTVGTLAQCPRCGEGCYRVMARPYTGGLYLMPHGADRRCHGPSSDQLLDLLLDQHGLRVSVRLPSAVDTNDCLPTCRSTGSASCRIGHYRPSLATAHARADVVRRSRGRRGAAGSAADAVPR